MHYIYVMHECIISQIHIFKYLYALISMLVFCNLINYNCVCLANIVYCEYLHNVAILCG